MHPTQAFYCELCKQFMNDSYQAEKHFKTAKHNRSYTVMSTHFSFLLNLIFYLILLLINNCFPNHYNLKIIGTFY